MTQKTKKPLTIAFQMDPMETVGIDGDTTFALAEVAQARGYEMFSYGPQDLSYNEGRVTAFARPTKVQRVASEPGLFEPARIIDLETDIDVVWMRQDPPFDMAYITAAHLLERLKGKTFVANDPEWVRSCPEKILPLDYPHLMPATLITRDAREIDAFRAKHKDIILKPLFGNGGAGVFRVKSDDPNYSSLKEMFLEGTREPVIAQAYLKDVTKGDKRIIIIDGEAVGARVRICMWAAQPNRQSLRIRIGSSAMPLGQCYVSAGKSLWGLT